MAIFPAHLRDLADEQFCSKVETEQDRAVCERLKFLGVEHADNIDNVPNTLKREERNPSLEKVMANDYGNNIDAIDEDNPGARALR